MATDTNMTEAEITAAALAQYYKVKAARGARVVRYENQAALDADTLKPDGQISWIPVS